METCGAYGPEGRGQKIPKSEGESKMQMVFVLSDIVAQDASQHDACGAAKGLPSVLAQNARDLPCGLKMHEVHRADFKCTRC